jgi:hypothetical protein
MLPARSRFRVGCSECRHFSEEETALKISEDVLQLNRGWDFLKRPILRENGSHLLEIIAIIGAEVNPPLWNQCLANHVRELWIDKPVPALLPFWPWIGEIDVESRN